MLAALPTADPLRANVPKATAPVTPPRGAVDRQPRIGDLKICAVTRVIAPPDRRTPALLSSPAPHRRRMCSERVVCVRGTQHLAGGARANTVPPQDESDRWRHPSSDGLADQRDERTADRKMRW